jgi:S-adenosylmethionine:tRNA ribosyltransferase-isomerase
MSLNEIEYHLPSALIAQKPAERRDSSRLLAVSPDGTLQDRVFSELDELLPPKSLLVFNDTRVIPARLRARRKTGGRVEIMLSRRIGRAKEGPGRISAERAPGDAEPADPPCWWEEWEAFCRPSRRLKPGERLELLASGLEPEGEAGEGGSSRQSGGPGGQTVEGVLVEIKGKLGSGEMVVRFFGERSEREANDEGRTEACSDAGVAGLCHAVGETPLPPYIRRPSGERPTDRTRYQTVYADEPGAVAAPTAGLHFTEELLSRLDSAGFERASVTLHVGAGTFRPIRAERIEDHEMHCEWYRLPDATAEKILRARREGRCVVAVGTTTVRVLETCALGGTVEPGEGETRLFIYPGFSFNAVDAMVTNFHLPRSTLLLLVAAFAGRKNVLDAYRHAVERSYRFYSYGDAMLLFRGGSESLRHDSR